MIISLLHQNDVATSFKRNNNVNITLCDNVMITSLLRQSDVATSFLRSDNVIITLCIRWDAVAIYVLATSPNVHFFYGGVCREMWEWLPEGILEFIDDFL